MFSRQIRHSLVALGLIAAVSITAASAAGSVSGTRDSARAPQSPPTVSGDLGEVIVRAPHDLGEIIVRAPHDLEDVLVAVRPLPPPGQYLAQIVVTAPRTAGWQLADGAIAALAALR